MELISIKPQQVNSESTPLNFLGLEQKSSGGLEPKKIKKYSPFIEANAIETAIESLSEECVVPVFAKDNERTIAHQEFIETALDSVSNMFRNEAIDAPEIRVSHQVKGRIPGAIHKNAKDLLPHEKTQYYERMAFAIRIPSITAEVNGNSLALMVGGVRAYNHQNLYSSKSLEKFKFFIGFQNMVCCNLCISSDGLKSEMKAASQSVLGDSMSQVIDEYNMQNHLVTMRALGQHSLTEYQFAQLLGRTRMYQHLSKEIKAQIPALELTDGQINTIAKGYYQDSSFRGRDEGINLWDLFNLFTSANKSSYIDTFLERNSNAFTFTQGLSKALQGDHEYSWYLS